VCEGGLGNENLKTNIMKCFFTDREVNPINAEREGLSYIIEGTQINVIDQEDKTKYIFDSTLFKDNKHIFRGIIFNRKWPLKKDEWVRDEKDLQKILNEVNYPKTPKEKLDNLLVYLANRQKFEGQIVEDFNPYENNGQLVIQLYFKNNNEFKFYEENLVEEDLIKHIGNNPNTQWYKYQITYKGLTKLIELQEEGKHSNNCFIAMSFNKDNPEITDIRNAIKEVVEDLKFSPKIVDEVHYESEKTINDAIVALIKQSKFAICDFTEQKDGVYFEAGYAAGRGIPVIYTCKKKDFEESHFDTNHFPHIVYETTNELKEKLKNKIEAWIL
jgi:nucleoside 2-deoxyribosyltransferase